MIRLAAYLDRESGWAQHARSFADALHRHERTELVDCEELDGPRRGTWRTGWRRWFPSRSVGIVLGADDRTSRLGTRYRIAFSVAETTRLPLPKLLHLMGADQVWTMSAWGQGILRANAIPEEKIRIVPAGVDTERFHPRPDARTAAGVFRFLCVGKWEERKGNAGLVRAFAEEFSPIEPVELVMHCGTAWPRSIDVSAEIARQIAAAGREHSRVVYSAPVDAAGLVGLMQGCDAFVLPTRGEGWGLPILEAMACGLPCIVTDYSGLREYTHEENAYLVRVAGMMKVHDPEFYPPQYDWGEWAEPDWGHLRAVMRMVYENREQALAKGRQARADAERLWTWDVAARKALVHIKALRSG